MLCFFRIILQLAHCKAKSMNYFRILGVKWAQIIAFLVLCFFAIQKMKCNLFIKNVHMHF